MRARAREMRGQGRAEGSVELQLTEGGATTHGDMATEVTLSGPAAAMGRGLIQDVSARIVDDFATNLAAMLASGPAAPTAEAPELAPIPETAAPDAPTREFPALAAARPQGPDTAPPPQSEVTAAPPAGPATAAALGPSDEPPSPAAGEATPVEPPLGGPSAGPALRRLREPKVIGTIAAVAVVGLMLRRRRRR
jgi:hypothetical protein